MIRSTSETLFRLHNLNKEQQRVTYQTSSTKILQHGSDDANLFSRDVYLDDKINVYEGIKLQIEKTTAQNNVADSTLKEIKELLDYVKQEVTKAKNGTVDDEAREAIAVNLRGVKENLFMLANEQVEGEYLYAGSNSMKEPFSMDASGKITFEGDGFLRKVAVEDGSYREKGITGFETFMYNSEVGYKGDTLEFSKSDRIIDEGRFEWKLEGASPAISAESSTTTLSFSAETPLIDENGKVWQLNDSANALVDDMGNTVSLKSADSSTNTFVVDMSNFNMTPANAEAPAQFSKTQLVKYNEEGNATNEILQVKIGENKDFQVDLPDVDGTKFEAKGNTFDVIDNIINALELKDSNGNAISKDEAKDALSDGLEDILEAYEAANTGHAKLGGRNKVFEISLDRIESKINQYQIMSHEVGAADLTKLAVEAKALEVTFTALYSTISKMHELTLVNFVR
ncbi:flagellar biosynthesis protein FlgL [Arcobacter sp. CECT 8983]|uniref:flagellin N-terminal helical domain-containing protein n=1 Tax=Arcobacter sp. CECT 8983 TaxID=2044508 RepID=UPI00100B1F20|nr:flagellar hook-associated protein 3 [Arcobacter sp. CECT 8983]RXJ90224.1 flagellar biosynthesis protein FlgL [Arcobacter sp. CECT 8983]